MRKPRATAVYALGCSAHLQTEAVGGASYTFLFKWMLTQASAMRPHGQTQLHATDVVLPATGDTYTLSLFDEATQTQIFPAVGAPACTIVPQNTYAVATFKKATIGTADTIVDKPAAIADIIDKSLAALTPAAVAQRAATRILSEAKRLHETFDDAWAVAAKAPTEAFALALHPTVAKHFHGRHTDMEGGVRSPDGPFAQGFDAAYALYRGRLKSAPGGLHPVAAEVALLEAILTAVRHDMADAANQHSYLVMSAASGVDLQASQGAGAPGGSGTPSMTPSMGTSFGLETVIALDPVLITTPGTTAFKKITVRLALTNTQPGQQDRNLSADFKDCLASARRLASLLPPQSYIIEDGWFSEPDANAPSDVHSAIFHPTCGDGAVQICVLPPTDAFPHARPMTDDGFTAYTLFQVGVAVDPAFNPNVGGAGIFYDLGQHAPWTPSASGAPLPSSTLRTLLPREAQVQLRADPLTNALTVQDPRNYVLDPTLVRPALGTPYYFWSRAKQSNGLWTRWLPVKRLGADGAHYGLDAPTGAAETTFTVLAASPLPPIGPANAVFTAPWDVTTQSYLASVKVPSVKIKDTTATFNTFYGVSSYRVLLLAKILELNWAAEPTLALRGQARVVDADLWYLQQSLWYADLSANGWLLVGLGPDTTPAAGVAATVVDLGSLPPGYRYQAVVFAKRDPKLCYRVPDTPNTPGQSGRNAFPSGPPAMTTNSSGWKPPAARPRQLASAETDRIVPLRFDISEPTFTEIVDAAMQALPPDKPVFSTLPPTFVRS